MAVKVVIFDFDGTIADTYGAFVKIVNKLSGEFGYKPMTAEDLHGLKQLSSREILQKADISLIKIPFLLKRVKDELAKEIVNLGTFSGFQPCLLRLKKRGITLGIITSNARKNVQIFLDKNNLSDLFDFIYCGTTLFGKHKIIDRVLKKHKFNHSEVVYVGDETRDIYSAQKSQIKIIAVGWGFNYPQVLAEYNPDKLIYHPSQLIEAIESYGAGLAGKQITSPCELVNKL
jgi:phosphoglycolate phosphatase